jgi:hypothetical protein
MTTYRPVKQRENDELRAALVTQLRKDLESTDKASARQRETAIEKLTELQVSGERLQAAQMAVGPLKERIGQLEGQVKELMGAAGENAAALSTQLETIAALESQVASVTQERDTARQDAERRGRESDASIFRLSDERNARIAAEKSVQDTQAALQTFRTGARVFVKALSIAPESLIDTLVKADPLPPVELLTACGIEETRANELLVFVAAAKNKSETAILHSLHKDGCRDRFKVVSRCGGPCPNAEQVKALKAILTARGVKDIEHKILILQIQHNPNAAVYVAPVDIPAVLSLEDREIERQKAAGTYVPPAPEPAPEKPTMVELTRYWAPIMPFRDPFQEFQLSMEEFYPEADRSRTAYERLRREGLALESAKKQMCRQK